MKTINEQVFDAIQQSGLLHGEESKENVLENRLIFTKAQRVEDIRTAVEELNVSTISERFSIFSNGILFTIVPL